MFKPAQKKRVPTFAETLACIEWELTGLYTKPSACKNENRPFYSFTQMHTDVKGGKGFLICRVGKTVLRYEYWCLKDLQEMLKKHGDPMEPGSTDVQKPAKDGTVEAWGRSISNPVGSWYGLKKGLRRSFGLYIPPLMETLGLV